MIGSTEEEITLHVGKLILHYPQPSLPVESNASRWDDWFDDFADVPPDVLAAACRDWRRSDAKFAPAPGQLLKLCIGSRAVFAKRAAEAIALLEAQ